METTGRSRFLLRDSMIMVVFAAIGALPLRYASGSDGLTISGPWGLIFVFRIFALPVLSALTIAATIHAFLPPRERFRRLVRYPGFAGCLAATAYLLTAILFLWITRFRKLNPPGAGASSLRQYRFALLSLVTSEQSATGFFVLGAILQLLLARRCGWDLRADGFRFAIAVLWIILGLTQPVMDLFAAYGWA